MHKARSGHSVEQYSQCHEGERIARAGLEGRDHLAELIEGIARAEYVQLLRHKQLRGIAIRDLRLPGDILILSVKRKGQILVTHGYTRLRKKDIVTAIGSVESLDKLRLIFGK